VSADSTFDLSDVVSKGFEASCVGRDGALYFWHGTFGVKVDRRTGKATLLTDPRALPDMAWMPTSLGAEELEAAVAKDESRGSRPAA